MNFTWDIDTKVFEYTGIGTPVLTRGDTATPIQVAITRGGVPCSFDNGVAPPEVWTLLFALKTRKKFSVPSLASVDTFVETATAGTYLATLTLNTFALNKAMGYTVNGTSAADIADLPVYGAIAVTEGVANNTITSAWLAFTVQNSVPNFEEETPVPPSTAEDWLTDRAVRYDIVQTLDAGQKTQAQENMGVEIGVDVQAYSATLLALSVFNSNGIVVQTSQNNFTSRSIGIGSNKLSIVNGSGVSGNPTLDIIESNLNLASIGGILGASQLANTSVVAGSYTNTNLTIDAQGRVTSASNGAVAAGTVTDFIFTNANGFTGVVSTSTTTPTLTLDVSGLNATKIADGSISNTEFQFLNGVTSSIQSQLNAKGSGTVTTLSIVSANGISGTVATATTTPAITLALGAITPSSVTVSGLTASQLVATDGSKVLQSLSTGTYPSLTELAYIKGVTSAIQTQIDAKAPLNAPSFTGGIIVSTGAVVTTNGAVTASHAASGNNVRLSPTGLDIEFNDGGTADTGILSVGAMTTTPVWTLPDATGTVMLNPTTIEGDLIYRNATVNTRLPKGTASQLLRMNAGATAPEWATISMGLTVGTTAITSGTAGRLFFEGSGNVLSQDADLSFSTDTLTATKLATTNVAITDGTVTASTPILTGTQTWNDGAVVFTGKSTTITRTASATGSKLEDWLVSGIGSVMSIQYNSVAGGFSPYRLVFGADASIGYNTNLAAITLMNATNTSGADVRAANFYPSASVQTGSFLKVGADVQIFDSGTATPGMAQNSSSEIRWTDNGSTTSTPSVGLSRPSTGLLKVTDGGAGIGKLTFNLDNSAVTGLGAGIVAALTNATVTLTDSTGQVYRIPCII